MYKLTLIKSELMELMKRKELLKVTSLKPMFKKI